MRITSSLEEIVRIPALRVQFTADERQQILRRIDTILEKGILSQGCNVQELEERFAAYVGARYALAVNSGSSAIEIPMRALQVSGKEVLVPTNTFLATATGVLFAGGKIRLVDADPTTFSVSLEELQRRATPQTVGVVIVHIGGIITPQIEAIRQWCDKRGYWLFEDAAHAHGSQLGERSAGTFGIAGSYSFFATKVMTSGEGGMIVTDDGHLAEQLVLYRNHGKPKPWVSYHSHLGSNYRMSEVTAAIAAVQLASLDEKIVQRERIAKRYSALVEKEVPMLRPLLPMGRSSWYKYILMLPQEFDRDEVKGRMKEKGIDLPGEVYELPLHRQPALAHLLDRESFPHADYVCRQHICLPIYPGITDEQVERIVLALAEVCKRG